MRHIVLALLLYATPAVAQSVESLNPLWLTTQLNHTGAKRVALSLCGEELHRCEEAKVHVLRMTAQCSGVYHAIIDVSVYKGTPRDLYDTEDPRFIMLKPARGGTFLEPIIVHGVLTPDTVAIVLCPEESSVFKSLMRMLRGLPL